MNIINNIFTIIKSYGAPYFFIYFNENINIGDKLPEYGSFLKYELKNYNKDYIEKVLNLFIDENLSFIILEGYDYTKEYQLTKIFHYYHNNEIKEYRYQYGYTKQLFNTILKCDDNIIKKINLMSII